MQVALSRIWKDVPAKSSMKSTFQMIALDFKYFGLTLPDLFSSFGKLSMIVKFLCQLFVVVVVIVRGFVESKVSLL